MLHEPFSSKVDLKKSFWDNIHLCRVVVWYGVNRLIINIPPSSHYSIHPFLQITGILVQYTAASVIPSPKQLRRPSPSLLYLFFYVLLLLQELAAGGGQGGHSRRVEARGEPDDWDHPDQAQGPGPGHCP